MNGFMIDGGRLVAPIIIGMALERARLSVSCAEECLTIGRRRRRQIISLVTLLLAPLSCSAVTDEQKPKNNAKTYLLLCRRWRRFRFD